MSFELLLLVSAGVEAARDGTWVPQIALSALVLAGLMAIYHKAGQPPLACLVPVLAEVKLLAIVDRPLYWLPALLLPLADVALMFTTGSGPSLLAPIGLVVQIWLFVLISQRFGKGTGTMLGMVFLPFVFVPVLGFGNAAYRPPRRLRDASARIHARRAS